MTGHHEKKGYAAVLATIVIWSTPSLFQFYLNRYYDPFAQNFYRYSVAFIAILPLAMARFRRRSRGFIRRLGQFIACALRACSVPPSIRSARADPRAARQVNPRRNSGASNKHRTPEQGERR